MDIFAYATLTAWRYLQDQERLKVIYSLLA